MSNNEMSDDDSFERLIDDLRAGSQEAYSEVFRKYAERLIRLARGRLSPQMRQKFDPEDVMQSVFRSFFARHDNEEFDIRSHDALWAILVVMAVRKCNRRVAKLKAAKRNVSREQDVAASDSRSDWQPPSREPTPEEEFALTELVSQLTLGLDREQQTVLEMRLQGYTTAEISEKVGLSERTVHRYLSKLRDRAATLDMP